MKRLTVLAVSAGLLASLLLSGCAKKAIIRKYYVLEADNAGSMFNLNIEPLPYRVDVRDFYVSKAFEQARIAVRSESHELDYFFYHNWAVRPSSAIADIIHSLFVRENIFRTCRRGHSLRPDYWITGQIYALERIHNRDQKASHLSGIIELIDGRNETPVVRYEFDQTAELLEDRSMNGFAKSLSGVIVDVSRTFVHRIVDYFENTAPEKTD